MNGITPVLTLPPSLTDVLQTRPHELLQPSQDLHTAILGLSKYYLDPVASKVSAVQQERLQEARKSRKRKRKAGDIEENVLRLRSIAVEGFDAQQVWEQARRVAAAVEGEVRRAVEAQKSVETVEEQDSSEESSAEDGEDMDGIVGGDMEEFGSDLEQSGNNMEEIDEEGLLEGEFDDEVDDQEDSDFEDPRHRSNGRLVEDKFGLNDGFFSIDDFNRRTEMLEQQDFKGDPDADAASDEEEIEWDLDPMSIGAQSDIKNKIEVDESEDEHEHDDDVGPTFGDMDLHAPEGESDEENNEGVDMDIDDVDEMNANNLMYGDFFDPPPRKKTQKESKRRQIPSKSRPNTINKDGGSLSDVDIQRTISAVHRDLFSDESEPEEDEKDQADPSNLSTHERRKATILAQIRELEANNVAKRPWVLAGEARAQDRPVNALLAEDLDFERTSKPLPVITAEISEEIEALIKRRVLAGEFDEVRKRRPDEALTESTRRGRLVDINLDNPDRKGLADVYEEEHLRKTDPAYVDQRSQKLKKEHLEIEALWKEISGKLDSLASFRYRPRPAEINIAVRTDAPAMSLEDARPSGVGGDVGTLGQLAPQEVYTPGEVKERGKVATKGGQVIDQAELTREDRKRRRRREKERAKKTGGQRENAAKKDTKQEKKVKVASDLKKGAVKIIGRKGELLDVDGNEVKDRVRPGGGSYKL